MDHTSGQVSPKRAASIAGGGKTPLLLTKLYAPRLPNGLIPRPGRKRSLDQALSHKLTLVSTPPGYGKSTLVSQWLEASPHASAWVSFDDADNDPRSFFKYLLAAIDTIDDELTLETRRLVHGQRRAPVRKIIDSLATELASATRPLLLVLDDFHTIQAPEILEGLGTLLAYAPPALHLILISRSDPRLPLMRMRARREIFELRATDLIFEPEETHALLCGHYGLPLDEEQLAVVQSWSEGWPLGLILLGQALQERALEQINDLIERFASNPDVIAEYLWRELIQRQPAERRQFLLQTSILSQFNPQLCDAVTGQANAETMLEALREENLFLIPLSGRGSWHRYHHLFNEVLLERLARLRPADEILELHRRAARWYLGEGLVDEAATHAIKAQDWDLALRILTPICTELFRQERLAGLRTWLEALPEDVVMRDPDLSFKFAWALIRMGRAISSRKFADAAAESWVATGDEIGAGSALTIRALEDFYLHNNARAVERCQQALALIPDDRIEDRARLFAVLGNIYTQTGDIAAAEAALVQCRLLAREMGSVSIQLVDMNASALCLLARGELVEAETLFQRVIATGDEWHDLPVVYAHLLLGGLYLDQLRLDLAEQLLERALELADRLSAGLHLIRIHGLMAELAWVRRDPETAFLEIERSIAAGGPDYFGTEVRYSRATLAQFWMQQGKLNLVRSWAAELDLDLDRPPEFSHVAEYLAAVELLAREGRTGRARSSLALATTAAREAGHRHNLLSMLLLQSWIELAEGNARASNVALMEAIEIGAGHGYMRPFLFVGEQQAAQLQEISRTSLHAPFIRRLLEAIRRGQLEDSGSSSSANLLSRRQTEIMRLVAAGYSNRDIADQLFISEQTVKKHLGNTFLRLDASNRTQAVDISRRLSII